MRTILGVWQNLPSKVADLNAQSPLFFGIAVAGLLLLLFGLDLALGFPFDRESTAMDVGFILCAAALGYVSWSTLREQI